jgi:hypothetical protein
MINKISNLPTVNKIFYVALLFPMMLLSQQNKAYNFKESFVTKSSWQNSDGHYSYGGTLWHGDTMVSGKNYRKIFDVSIYTNLYRYTGAIRFDSVAQKVLYLPGDSVKEFDVSVNLSVLLGDTVVFSNAHFRASRLSVNLNQSALLSSSDTFKVSRFDSIPINGVLRRFITYTPLIPFNQALLEVVFTEGIGFTGESYFEGGGGLECYESRSELSPINSYAPLYVVCDLGLVLGSSITVKNSQSKTVIISPNPVRDIFNLPTNHSFNSLKIYDQVGTEVLYLDNLNSSSVVVSKLKPGQYFVCLIGKNVTKTVKLLKW